MSQYPPRGALFQNQNKQKETQPDYTGNLEIPNDVAQDIIAQINEGIEAPKIDLAGWKKVGKSGLAFVSLRGNLERNRRGGASSFQAPSNNVSNDANDEIPF